MKCTTSARVDNFSIRKENQGLLMSTPQPPGPGPLSEASLGGPTTGQIGWGGPSTGPTLPFGAAGVSPCRCEPLRAGCCGGEGVFGVS